MGATATGYTLFCESVREEINDKVNTQRADEGLDSKAHAGMFQSLIGQRWRSLSAEEQAKWNIDATKQSAEASSRVDNNIFQQVVFIGLILNLRLHL